MLAGEAELADHAVRLRDNLIVAPTRAMTRNASEFLQAPDTVVALDAMQRAYDPAVMLFDMPPMGASDDVIGFLSNVDCALIVAAAGKTTIDEIGDCEREVAERTEVLGVVLNKCRYERKAPGYGDYYRAPGIEAGREEGRGGEPRPSSSRAGRSGGQGVSRAVRRAIAPPPAISISSRPAAGTGTGGAGEPAGRSDVAGVRSIVVEDEPEASAAGRDEAGEPGPPFAGRPARGDLR